MSSDDQDALARDFQATIAARAELGRDYEPALVESFVERLDATIARRVEAEVSRRAPPAHRLGGHRRGQRGPQPGPAAPPLR